MARLLFVVVLLMTSLSFAQESILQERLSIASKDCTNPRLVSKEDRIFVVWQGKIDERNRIFFRERRNGNWDPEIILDRSEWGNNTDPQIALDDEGNPHIIWIFSDPEISAVYYAFRLKEEWMFPDPLTQTPDKNCEFPDIGIETGTNRVFAVWQEGRGSKYAIMCSTQDKNGRFITIRISRPDSKGYNIYPQIFLSPTPVIVWYGLRDSDFALHAALLNIQTGSWMCYDPSGLENIPCNRLPFIMTDDQGLFYAVWYDSDGSTDRIFFNRQGDSSLDKAVIVDDNPQWMNSIPTGVVGSDKSIYICWRGESIFGGQIFLATGSARTNPCTFQESQLISDGQKLFYTQLDCCANGNLGVDIVWVSSALDGGDGAVYFRQFLN